MNYLEQLAAEWYEYSGYFVRTNVRTRKRKEGGYDVELDVLAYSIKDNTLLHIETSSDASSWEERKKRFLQRKFILSLSEYEKIIGSRIKIIKKLAIVGWTKSGKSEHNWGDDIEIILIPNFIEKIASILRQRDPAREAVPESYPILRSMQMVIAYGGITN